MCERAKSIICDLLRRINNTEESQKKEERKKKKLQATLDVSKNNQRTM